MSVETTQKYIAEGFPDVEGWLSQRILIVLAHLAEEMERSGVKGGACEIGVYKGKFMIGLSCIVDGRDSLAIDIFDDQENNIDGSGGNQKNLLQAFNDNVEKYSVGRIAAICTDSFSLSMVDQLKIQSEFGPFQLFSIDGGHEPEHVVNDYKFAEAVTHSGGAIIIDDILNAGWPGVMEGVANIFVGGKPKFVPFIIGHNKLVLVGKSYHARYMAAMEKRLGKQLLGVEYWARFLYGHKVISLL